MGWFNQLKNWSVEHRVISIAKIAQLFCACPALCQENNVKPLWWLQRSFLLSVVSWFFVLSLKNTSETWKGLHAPCNTLHCTPCTTLHCTLSYSHLILYSYVLRATPYTENQVNGVPPCCSAFSFDYYYYQHSTCYMGLSMCAKLLLSLYWAPPLFAVAFIANLQRSQETTLRHQHSPRLRRISFS